MADQDVATEGATTPAAGSLNGRVRPSEGEHANPLRLEFADRLEEARGRLRSAAEALEEATFALRADGRPPSYELVFGLGECRREFLRLRAQLTRRAAELSIPVPALETLTGLTELARLFDLWPARSGAMAEVPAGGQSEASDDGPARTPQPNPPTQGGREVISPSPLVGEDWSTPGDRPDSATALSPPSPLVGEDRGGGPVPLGTTFSTATIKTPVDPSQNPVESEHPSESIRRTALAVLDEVARLRHRDAAEFPPLVDCQARASELEKEISARPLQDLTPEAASLADGGHPLVALLDVVRGMDDLSDAQWASVHAALSGAFGRQLAVAAARGRLAIAPGP